MKRKNTKILLKILILILISLTEPMLKGENLPPELMQLILHTPSVINERDVDDFKTWIEKVESGIKQHIDYSNVEFGWENHLIISAPYKYQDLNFDSIECGKFLSLDIMSKALFEILEDLIKNHRKILEASSDLSISTTLKIIESLQSEFEIISDLSEYIESKKISGQKKLINFHWPLDYSKILKKNLENKDFKILSTKINTIQYKGARWEKEQVKYLPEDLFKNLPEMNLANTSIESSLWVETTQFCNSKHVLKITMDLETKVNDEKENVSLNLFGLPISTQSQKSFSFSEFIHHTESLLARSQAMCNPATTEPKDLFKCLLLQDFKVKSLAGIDSKEIENQSWVESAKQYFLRTKKSNIEDLKIIKNLIKVTSRSCKTDFLPTLISDKERNTIESLLEDESLNFKKFLCSLK